MLDDRDRFIFPSGYLLFPYMNGEAVDYLQARRSDSERLDEVTQSLKAVGLLVRTEHETLEAKLDLAFPNTVSKTAVEYEGARYERWYSPATRSLSGRPMTWAKGWTRLEP